MRSLLALSIFALLGLLAAPGAVIAANLPGELCNMVGSNACNCYDFGNRTTPTGTIPKCVRATGEISCPIGTTTMGDDQKNLVACLLDEDNYPRWKSMSAASDVPSGTLRGFCSVTVGAPTIATEPAYATSYQGGCACRAGYDVTGIETFSFPGLPDVGIPPNDTTTYTCMKR